MRSDTQQADDQTLVRNALAEREAFAAIVQRHEGALRRYITRLSSFDTDVVNDAMQETFIKAYVHLNDYDQSLPLAAWLYRIARNEVFTHFRRQKNRPHAVVNDSDIELFDSITDDLDIAREADRKFDAAVIRSAIRGLDLKYRDAVLLRFFEGKSYREISDIMQVPEGTVAAYISRAKTQLRAVLLRYDANV